MQIKKPNWWLTDTYTDETAFAPETNLMADEFWGPKGPAITILWKNGKTQPGWGRAEFMQQYMRGLFDIAKTHLGYIKDRWAFTWIMRSSKLICIDIDGKNDGFRHASELGLLPPTLSETSKSGNGYHLFYSVEDVWDDKDGFAGFSDVIGIVQGVDIRGTGCVYHYNTQRWNGRDIVPLPRHLVEKLTERKIRRQLQSQMIEKSLDLEPEEIAMLHDELLDELKKDVPAGRRNNTLFAIGTKLKQAQYAQWETAIYDRGQQLGLPHEELMSLNKGIKRYADTNA